MSSRSAANGRAPWGFCDDSNRFLALYEYGVKLFVDHLVVMRKGGYPVAMNQIPNDSSSKTYIEDLLIPSDSQIPQLVAVANGSAPSLKGVGA
ncbi:hypothetical protein ANN_09963 [Periplaneta americana]|uniref:Uncharacterized protein n=1 Tax=Periplaneta americana TaxID=6978 RepID=A0ABQ8TNR5_PERAM|nr:hypothetical protein ANN_09963 [Periplaneta americana]